MPQPCCGMGNKNSTKVAKPANVYWIVRLSNGTTEEFGSSSLASAFVRKHPGSSKHPVERPKKGASASKKGK